MSKIKEFLILCLCVIFVTIDNIICYTEILVDRLKGGADG